MIDHSKYVPSMKVKPNLRLKFKSEEIDDQKLETVESPRNPETFSISKSEEPIKAMTIEELLDFNVKELTACEKANGGHNVLSQASKIQVDQILGEEWEKVKNKQKKFGMITP